VFRQPKRNRQFCKSIPGWNECVCDTCEAANDAYQLWHMWNKPRSGPIFQFRQRTRATLNMLFACRRHEQEMVAEVTATDLTKHDYHAFWKRVNKTKTPFTTFTTNVGNASWPTGCRPTGITNNGRKGGRCCRLQQYVRCGFSIM